MTSETCAAPQRSRVSFTGPVGQSPGRRPEPPLDARQRTRRRSLGEQSSTCGASVYVVRAYAASETARARLSALEGLVERLNARTGEALGLEA